MILWRKRQTSFFTFLELNSALDVFSCWILFISAAYNRIKKGIKLAKFSLNNTSLQISINIA